MEAAIFVRCSVELPNDMVLGNPFVVWRTSAVIGLVIRHGSELPYDHHIYIYDQYNQKKVMMLHAKHKAIL